MTDTETTRAFIAVEIPAINRAAILEFQTRLADQVHGLRWVSGENLHLTLAFLGDVADDDLPALNAEIADAVAAFSPFAMMARGLGAFPTAAKTQTVWVGLETAGPLLPLRDAVAEAAGKAGCPPKDDRFTPHVTIARANRNARRGVDLRGPIGQYASWSAGSWNVAEVVTYRSDLTPKGPIYSPLARAELLGKKSAETD
jgi:2'-5' RNA ligase